VDWQRLHRGELTTLAGALALSGVMFLNWYQRGDVHVFVGGAEHTGPRQTGWEGVGDLGSAIVAFTVIAALLWVAALLAQKSYFAFLAWVATVSLASLALVILITRLFLQPGLGLELGNDEVELLPSAFMGPSFAAAVLYGALRAPADDRVLDSAVE